MVTAAPQILVPNRWLPAPLEEIVRHYNPRTDVGKLVVASLRYLPSDLARELLESVQRSLVVEAELSLVALRNPDSRYKASSRELIERYGVVSRKLVTDAGVAAIVDAFQNTVELENFKFHGLGTGSTAESQAQTGLVTELTTEYTANVRATGTTEEGATGNIFKTVATNTLDSGTPVLREHAVLTQAATGGGTMLDRSLFAAITLDGTVGDGLQSTYQLTFAAGG